MTILKSGNKILSMGGKVLRWVPPVPPVATDIKYGYLYNWYVTANIAGAGWRVPSDGDWDDLVNHLGGESVAGGKLKETGFTYWSDPNESATNEVGFNARGGGYRSNTDGEFAGIMNFSTLWTSDNNVFFIFSSDATASTFSNTGGEAYGYCVRLIKDTTTLTNGQTGTYTGNDGKVYRTICINNQEWLADNLAETKYNTGADIPEVTDNATWAGLTTSARCSYLNDEETYAFY